MADHPENENQRRVISSTPHLGRDDIVNQAFPQAFRGLSEAAVRAFLRKVADEVDALRTRHDELLRQVDDLEMALASRDPVPVRDESDLLAAVGDETARVLRSAKESADDIRRSAEERAAQLVHDAQEDARVLREETEAAVASRTREADEASAEILREAERLARELQEGAEARAGEFESEARAEAEAELDSARRRAREVVAEAEAARDRMLAELSHRRETLEAQLESLKGGRDRLLDAYRVVKRTLDEATEALRQVDVRTTSVSPGVSRGPGRVMSPALPPRPEWEEEEHTAPAAQPPEPVSAPSEPEPESQFTDPGEAELASAPPGRVGSFTLGELDHEPRQATDEPAPGPPPAETGEPPRGVRVLGPEPDTGREDDPPSGRPQPSAPAGSGDAGTDADDHGRQPSASAEVDELFARLKAQREARAERPEPVPATSDAPGPGATADPDVAAAETPGGSGGEERRSEGADDAPPIAARDDVTRARDDRLARKRRDALDALTTDVVRAVKRVIRDEQNVVLEAVREHKGTPSADDVLPSVAGQDQAFLAATAETLAGACRAGIRASVELGLSAGNGEVDAGALGAEMAAGLAREIMDPLRGKLGDTMRDAEADEDLEERVRARYRELKGARLEHAIRDALSAGFVLGVYESVRDGVALRWVTVDAAPCADCADNTLENVTKGAAFPTGHRHPPAHAGCHCLLAPVDMAAASVVS